MLRRALHNQMRQEMGAIYDVDVGWEFSGNVYEMWVHCSGFKAEKICEFEAIVQKNLANFADNKKLFEKTKAKQVKRRILCDSSGRTMRNNSMEELAVWNRIITLEDEMADRQQMTFDDLQGIAKWLTPNHRRIYIEKP